MIQLIDYKKPVFYINIHGKPCQFIPVELYTQDNFLPVPKKVKGSTLGWYINRRWISYNQIRDAVISYSKLLKKEK